MTIYIETLGRAPIMRHKPKPETYTDFVDEDWRGESIIRNVARDRSTYNGLIFGSDLKGTPKPPKRTRGGPKICAAHGCETKLKNKNVSGMCKEHVHGPRCRCLKCVSGEIKK